MDLELRIARENTAAFIAARPSVIELTPVSSRQRTASAGYTTVPGAPREPQTLRIIELGMIATEQTIKLQDGTQHTIDFWLLGKWDAAIEVGDHWKADDGREWEVGEVIRANGYEVRAVVAERGR